MAVQFSDITTGTLDGTGHFDLLMRTLRAHIEDMVDKTRLTQAEAGAIYTGVIPSMIQESVRFELSVDAANKDIEIKDYELANILPEQLTKLQEEVDLLQNQDVSVTAERHNNAVTIQTEAVAKYGYNSASVDANDEVVLGARDSVDGIFNAQESEILADTARKDSLNTVQVNSIVTGDTLKTNMTNADVALKGAQQAVAEAQDDKVTAEKDEVLAATIRRDAMNTKDLEVKDAQKTKTYRDAVLVEQQKLLLSKQTAYEDKKSETLNLNTKANMIIKQYEKGVSEIQAYLGNGTTAPTNLPAGLETKVADARADLEALSDSIITK